MVAKQKMVFHIKYKFCLVNSDLIYIGKLGRTLGLGGEFKFHLETDFIEQFQKGVVLYFENLTPLTIETFHKQKSSIKFCEINSIDEATKFVNKQIYTTKEDTRKNCKLKKGEYFWFDLIGLEVYEGDRLLGVVQDINRYTNTDYFEILTDKALVEQKHPKIFLIPYLDKFIHSVYLDEKKIMCVGGYDILLNS